MALSLSEDLIEIGRQVNAAVELWRFPAATWAAQFFSFVGSVSGYMLLIPLYCWIVSLGNGFFLYAGFLLCNYLNVVLKDTLQLNRPFVDTALNALERPDSYSFPSGHSQMVAFVWIFLFVKHRSTWMRNLAAVFILATGFSRVYLGAHYFFDVVVGWGIGIAVALLFLKMEDIFYELLKDPPAKGWFALGALILVLSIFIFPTELMYASVGGAIGFFIALLKNRDFSTLLSAGRPSWARISGAYVGMLCILVLHSTFHQMAARFAIYTFTGLWVLWLAPKWILAGGVSKHSASH